MLELLRWRVFAVAWAAQIFVLSMPSFGGTSSRPLLARVLALLRIELAPDAFLILHVILRKAAHLGIYAILGYLLYRSLADPLVQWWQPKPAIRAFLLAAFYSVSDEIHQHFVPNRGASLTDCLIDCAGAALGLLFLYFALQWPNGIAKNRYAFSRDLHPAAESTEASRQSRRRR